MNNNWFVTIPEQVQDKARAAVASTFGSASICDLQPVFGGVSGALAYRFEVSSRSYLLRVENKRSPLRNPHQYTCMDIAAQAGIAPRLHHVDADAGVVIMDFVKQRPLSAYPGGSVGVAAALGELASKLQAIAAFPVVGDFRNFIERMLNHVRSSAASELLDPHVEAFAMIRNACPWDAATHVSSHNDPNPRNILFDGEKLWLVDWETAYRNDALVDVAILSENHAATPELEAALLQAWLGRQPDALLRARLVLIRQMTRMYYATLLLALSANAQSPLADLVAPTPDEFKALIANGQLKPAGPDTMLVLAKMLLAGFMGHMNTPALKAALVTAQN